MATQKASLVVGRWGWSRIPGMVRGRLEGKKERNP